MTIADSSRRRSSDRWLRRGLALGVLGAALASCGPKLVDPGLVVSPYDGTRLFAVAPPLNESGVSRVDTVRTAELFTEELEMVHGLGTLPTSRVIAAMQALEMQQVASVDDAEALMAALGVDGLIVGSITAWNPYPPMVMGMSTELVLRDAPTGAVVDPRAVTMAVAGTSRAGPVPDAPVSQASGVFDASNHSTLKKLAVYSSGRSEPESAFGADIYLVSTEPYTRFVSYELISELMSNERMRLGLAQTARANAETGRDGR